MGKPIPDPNDAESFEEYLTQLRDSGQPDLAVELEAGVQSELPDVEADEARKVEARENSKNFFQKIFYPRDILGNKTPNRALIATGAIVVVGLFGFGLYASQQAQISNLEAGAASEGKVEEIASEQPVSAELETVEAIEQELQPQQKLNDSFTDDGSASVAADTLSDNREQFDTSQIGTEETATDNGALEGSYVENPPSSGQTQYSSGSGASNYASNPQPSYNSRTPNAYNPGGTASTPGTSAGLKQNGKSQYTSDYQPQSATYGTSLGQQQGQGNGQNSPQANPYINTGRMIPFVIPVKQSPPTVVTRYSPSYAPTGGQGNPDQLQAPQGVQGAAPGAGAYYGQPIIAISLPASTQEKKPLAVNVNKDKPKAVNTYKPAQVNAAGPVTTASNGSKEGAGETKLLSASSNKSTPSMVAGNTTKEGESAAISLYAGKNNQNAGGKTITAYNRPTTQQTQNPQQGQVKPPVASNNQQTVKKTVVYTKNTANAQAVVSSNSQGVSSLTANSAPTNTAGTPITQGGMVMFNRKVSPETTGSSGGDVGMKVVYQREKQPVAPETPASDSLAGLSGMTEDGKLKSNFADLAFQQNSNESGESNRQILRTQMTWTDGVTYNLGDRLQAKLLTKILVAPGIDTPVVIEAADKTIFIGVARLNLANKVEVELSRAVRNGQEVPVKGRLLSTDHQVGLDASFREDGPTLGSDLLRAAINGVSSYVDNLANKKKTTYMPNGGIVQESGDTPNLSLMIGANVAKLFALPTDNKVFTRVAEVPAGQAVQVLIGV